jgi:hypothetical protein
VKDDAPLGETELKFMDGGRQSGGTVTNRLIAEGRSITPALASSFVFVNARVSILPDGTVFVRGDANGDGEIDLTDPISILGFLFKGGPSPGCLDAADANDDGTVNIADPIALLQSLFLDGRPLPPPTIGSPDRDPTADRLDCLRSY